MCSTYLFLAGGHGYVTPFSELCPYRMGQLTWQWPNPYGPADVGQRSDCFHTARVGRRYIVPIPYGWANATLYPYHMGGPTSPFSDISHTIWASWHQLKGWLFSYRMGGPMLHCTHTAWVGQCYIVPIPHGWANATLYPYHMGGPAQYCTCTAWVGQGELHTVAFTIYITCLFG